MLIGLLIAVATLLIVVGVVLLLARTAYYTYHEGVPGVVKVFGIIIVVVLIVSYVLLYFFTK